MKTKQQKLISMISLLLLLLACVFLCRENFKLGKSELVKVGMVIGGKFFLTMIPMIAIFSVITGQIKAHYNKVPNHLGEIVAGKSITNASLAGISVPGSATMGPVLQDKWKNGGNKFAIIGFLIAGSLLNWTTLIFQLPFLGGKLTSVIFGVGIVVTGISVVILILLQRLYKV